MHAEVCGRLHATWQPNEACHCAPPLQVLQAAQRRNPLWELQGQEAVAAWDFCKRFLLDKGRAPSGTCFPGQWMSLY